MMSDLNHRAPEFQENLRLLIVSGLNQLGFQMSSRLLVGDRIYGGVEFCRMTGNIS